MEPASPKRLVAYCRVSTDEQAESGLGLDAQQLALDRAFDYEGWVLAERIHDAGASASTLDRPGLQLALQLIADGEADGIVVAKLDRLTRSIIDFGALLEWLRDADADLVALDLRLDTSTAMGAFAAQLLILIAEWERRTIAERTRAALAAKRAKGQPTGRPSIADTPDLLARILSMHTDGLSTHQIASRLNDDGVPTVRGGARWRASAIQTALGYERPPARRPRARLPELGRRRSNASHRAGATGRVPDVDEPVPAAGETRRS